MFTLIVTVTSSLSFLFLFHPDWMRSIFRKIIGALSIILLFFPKWSFLVFGYPKWSGKLRSEFQNLTNESLSWPMAGNLKKQFGSCCAESFGEIGNFCRCILWHEMLRQRRPQRRQRWQRQQQLERCPWLTHLAVHHFAIALNSCGWTYRKWNCPTNWLRQLIDQWRELKKS